MASTWMRFVSMLTYYKGYLGALNGMSVTEAVTAIETLVQNLYLQHILHSEMRRMYHLATSDSADASF